MAFILKCSTPINNNAKVFLKRKKIEYKFYRQTLLYFCSFFFLFFQKKNKKIGGISSYSLLIMIIAYLKDNNAGPNDDYCSFLIGFLKFYGKEFNPDISGISLGIGKWYFSNNFIIFEC